MPITIIECALDSITLTRFIRKGGALIIEYEARKLLQYIQSSAVTSDWIPDAAQAICQLVAEAKTISPIRILLPGSALLTKVIQVPRVSPSKQAEIIQTHVHTLLGTAKDTYLAYDVVNVREFELDVVYTLVKKDWIDAFCQAIELIGTKVTSIEPPAIHYYNAYRSQFSKNTSPTLFAVIQETSKCYLLINQHLASIHQVLIKSTSIAEEIKELINAYNKKHPEYGVQEVVITGQNADDGEFVDDLRRRIGLPIKTFLSQGTIGSIGAAQNEGLSIDLTPATQKKAWAFNRNKKAILFAGACIAASLLIVLNSINSKIAYYEERGAAFETKIQPLKEWASIIERNEKTIAYYNEGLRALESIGSNKSWSHFLNSLQNSLVTVPSARIHSLKIVEPEDKPQNRWEDEFMNIQDTSSTIPKPRLMQITGSWVMNQEAVANDAIDKVKSLMLEFDKLEFVGETTNFHFDTHNLPIVTFTVSLPIMSQYF